MRFITRRPRWIAAAAFGLATSACGSSAAPEADRAAANAATVCTLIGCVDQLVVTVVPRPAESFVVRVADQGGTSKEQRCDQATQCTAAGDTSAVANFREYTPAHVTVTVAAADGRTARLDAAPVYAPVHPNGPQCAAGCRAGRVVVAWPY